MFNYPDFFKVGIPESGNHDNRNYEDDWGERYQGLLVPSGPSDNYTAEANQVSAAGSKAGSCWPTAAWTERAAVQHVPGD